MDSFELNKIMGAILGTCLGLLSLNIAANAIFHPVKPAKPGYEISIAEQPARDQKGAPAQQDPPVDELLASADLARGETSHNKCVSCHTFDKGGRNLVGPNLYGVIGREKGSEAGFNYSAGVQEGDEGPLDGPGDQRLRQESEAHGSRHQHDLRRYSAGERARRPDPVPQQQVRQAAEPEGRAGQIANGFVR